jgi:hypothetical protein
MFSVIYSHRRPVHYSPGVESGLRVKVTFFGSVTKLKIRRALVPIDHSYAANEIPNNCVPKRTWTTTFFGNHRTWPLRIMCIISILPSMARAALAKHRKSWLARTRCLIARLSCSTMLFRYGTDRHRHHRPRCPLVFNSEITRGYDGFPFTLMTLGRG